jgi:biotin transporter BioY
MLLRKRAPLMERPYRIWLYPVPCFVSLAGWAFLFATSGGKIIFYCLASLLLGAIFFLIWSWRTRRWPYQAA